MSDPRGPLRRGDFLGLVLFCLVLFGFTLLENRPLSGHQSVVPQSAREMCLDHDWLVPKVGGLPWLERPPLSHWIQVALVKLHGCFQQDEFPTTAEWVFRLSAVLVAAGVILLTAWMASVWFGRIIGLLSGLILATTWEFYSYANNPEADIYLCLIVTAALAAFVYLEFVRPRDEQENAGFFGRRPWPLFAFFILLGATNLAKGLIFGTLMVLVPVAGYLLLSGSLRTILRYVTFWGWLVFALVWLSWPAAVYLRYPDAIDLWLSDYVGRLNRGYIREPVWYYFITLPWVVFPWTVPAFVGFWLTWRQAWRGVGGEREKGRKGEGEKRTPERFLWVWALLTPAVFSIPDGKHHHYLLQCLAPWAVLSALGAFHLWRRFVHGPAWLKNPLFGLLTAGMLGNVAIWIARRRIPQSDWLVPALLIAWPLFVFALWWAVSRPNGRVALASSFSILIAFYCLRYDFVTRYADSYHNETVFLSQVRAVVPSNQTIRVNFDERSLLETFRLLFYLEDRAVLLHNLTFLLDERIPGDETFILARRKDAAQLALYGTPEALLVSDSKRCVSCPEEARTLFRLRFHDHLPRRNADLRISPMQATHRAAGPFLDAPERESE